MLSLNFDIGWNRNNRNKLLHFYLIIYLFLWSTISVSIICLFSSQTRFLFFFLISSWHHHCSFFISSSLYLLIILAFSSSEPEAYLGRDPADGGAAQHGEGGDSCLVLQPPAERETHQPLQQHHPSPAQPDLACCDAQSLLLQPAHGTVHFTIATAFFFFFMCV